MSRNPARSTFAAAALLLMFAALMGCRADNIFFSVENHSGGTLHNVKVTYPGEKITIGPLIGSKIDIGTLNNSTILGTYRHFDGPGKVTVSYSTEDGRAHSFSSPQVTGDEKGNVTISIEGNSVSFDMKFDESQH
ncbi:MAG: hypothetical protein ABSF16_14900 [Terracidiphilus sp.]|jgi:hypothetical protein